MEKINSDYNRRSKQNWENRDLAMLKSIFVVAAIVTVAGECFPNRTFIAAS